MKTQSFMGDYLCLPLDIHQGPHRKSGILSRGELACELGRCSPVNFQSVIDSPERVRRVSPPSTTILNTHAAVPPSHQAKAFLDPSDKPSLNFAPGKTCEGVALRMYCTEQDYTEGVVRQGYGQDSLKQNKGSPVASLHPSVILHPYVASHRQQPECCATFW